MLLQSGVFSFLKWINQIEPNRHGLDPLFKTCQSNKEYKDEDFLISYHANEVSNEALEKLKEAFCTSAIMSVCGIGDVWWSTIMGMSRKSATIKQHGNASKNNAKISEDNPVIRNLTDHFTKVENMAEVIATRVMRVMSGKVTLKDSSDTKKYLPPWLTKLCSYKECALKCDYKVPCNNSSHASSKWVGKGSEPERRIISCTHFPQCWNQNHNNLVVSLPTEEICSLCHVLSNQHCYNLSHDLFFCKETDEVETNIFDLDNSFVCDPPDWDSDKEIMGWVSVQSKQSLTTHVYVPAGNQEV